MTSLSSTIDSLYCSFEDVAKPTSVEACPCCMTAEETEILLAKPLRELTSSDLSTYSADALLTVGSVADYVYFLPRILDISINDEMWWPDIEVSAKKIKTIVETGLSSDKSSAITNFFDAAIEHILQTENYHRLDEWVCAIAAAHFDVHSALERIEAKSDAVIEYFASNAKELNRDRLSNAFWVLPNEKHDEIVAWFKSKKVSNILMNTYGYRT